MSDLKILGGAMGGVALPLIVEFGAKGARINETNLPYKVSGVVGAGIGVVTGLLPLWKNYPLTKNMAPEDRHAVMAFGGANFATGVGILILDELRKRALYAFKEELPLSAGEEGLELPPGQRPPEELIKEI